MGTRPDARDQADPNDGMPKTLLRLCAMGEGVRTRARRRPYPAQANGLRRPEASGKQTMQNVLRRRQAWTIVSDLKSQMIEAGFCQPNAQAKRPCGPQCMVAQESSSRTVRLSA